MPLDPSLLIPNAGLLQSIAQPKPLPSPIELQTQQLALQNQRLQSQANQLQLQQQQREAAAQQATLQAFRDANGDPDQAVANLYKSGLPQQAMALQTNRVALQKSLADAQKLKLDNQAHVADMLSRSAQNVLDADPAHRAMAYQYYKGQAEQNGWIPPNTLSPVYTPDLDPQLESMVKQGQSLKDQAITAKNQAQSGEAAQKTATAQQQDVFNTLSAAKNDQELQQGLQKLQARNVPESMLAPYRNVTWTPDLAKQLQTQALSPEQRAQQPKLEAETTAAQVKNAMPRLLNAAGKGPDVWTAALKQESPEVQQFYGSLGSNPSLAEVQRMGMTPAEQIGVAQKTAELGISRARLGIAEQREQRESTLQNAYSPPGSQGLTGDAYLKTLPPGMQATVQQMARGDLPLPPSGSRSPAAQAMLQAVLTYDPTASSTRYQTVQQFTHGQDSKDLVRLTTALEHADRAKTNSAALGNSLSLLTGKNLSDDAAAYRQDVIHVADEVGGLIKSGTITEGEAKQLQDNLNSPIQSHRDAALAEAVHLLGGKVEGIVQKYRAGTQQDIPVNRYFDLTTAARMQRYGVGPQAPPGQTGIAAPTAPARTVTNDHILQYAQQKGISTQQALKEFQAAGYQLTK